MVDPTLTNRSPDSPAAAGEGKPTALARELRKAGVDTTFTCEDPKGWIQVRFASPGDALSLLNIMARYIPEGETLRDRIAGTGGSKDWKYAIEPMDLTLDWNQKAEIELNWRPSARFSFSVCITFPVEDLPLVIGLVADYNGS